MPLSTGLFLRRVPSSREGVSERLASSLFTVRKSAGEISKRDYAIWTTLFVQIDSVIAYVQALTSATLPRVSYRRI